MIHLHGYEADGELDELLNRGFRYATSLIHDRARAEDLLQEACLRISRKGGPWRIEYLITVIRNVAIDRYRRNSKMRFEPLSDVASREDPIGEARDGFGDEMHHALGRLRNEERELLFLFAVEGYTATELAVLTDRPRGTILSMIHRAKKKLRDMLEPSDGRVA